LAVLARAFRSSSALAVGVAQCALATLLLAAPPPGPQGVSEYKVKAAFLFNFAKFVEWPERHRATQSVTIGVVGADPFGDSLDQVVLNKMVGSKSIEIRRFASLEEMEPCHILFISRSESSRLGEILKALEGTATLTVGEDEEFLRKGGVIRFFTQENKIRFEINVDAAEYEGLRLSSRLLQVARTVAGNEAR
jgi:YfiR/HmsC-like